MESTTLRVSKSTKLGKSIKKRLIEKDMTQRQLAERVGVSNVYLNQIISGQRSGKKYLEDILRELDLDISKVLKEI